MHSPDILFVAASLSFTIALGVPGFGPDPAIVGFADPAASRLSPPGFYPGQGA